MDLFTRMPQLFTFCPVSRPFGNFFNLPTLVFVVFWCVWFFCCCVFFPDPRSISGSYISFSCQVSLVLFKLKQFLTFFFSFKSSMTWMFFEECSQLCCRMSISLC